MLMTALTSRRASATLARAIARRASLAAANDNDGGSDNNLLMRAALRHFAAHGLNAPENARQRAQEAFFAGDRGKYDEWLQICRTLDRRLAESLLVENRTSDQG